MRTETVAESFATYRQEVLPRDAPDVQVNECQRAFYAGTYFMLMNLLHNIGDPETNEEQGIQNLEALKAEIEAFAASGGLPLPTPVPPPPIVREPSNYTVPDPHDIQPLLKDLGDHLRGEVPHGFGFTLLIFTFGPGGSLFYISNADRSDMIATMHEFIRRQTQ